VVIVLVEPLLKVVVLLIPEEHTILHQQTDPLNHYPENDVLIHHPIVNPGLIPDLVIVNHPAPDQTVQEHLLQLPEGTVGHHPHLVQAVVHQELIAAVVVPEEAIVAVVAVVEAALVLIVEVAAVDRRIVVVAVDLHTVEAAVEDLLIAVDHPLVEAAVEVRLVAVHQDLLLPADVDNFLQTFCFKYSILKSIVIYF
jgi:hypothetical protein